MKDLKSFHFGSALWWRNITLSRNDGVEINRMRRRIMREHSLRFRGKIFVQMPLLRQ